MHITCLVNQFFNFITLTLLYCQHHAVFIIHYDICW